VPITNGYFPQSQRQTQILILEILQCIPVAKIFIFLDLAKIISFLYGHYLKNEDELDSISEK